MLRIGFDTLFSFSNYVALSGERESPLECGGLEVTVALLLAVYGRVAAIVTRERDWAAVYVRRCVRAIWTVIKVTGKGQRNEYDATIHGDPHIRPMDLFSRLSGRRRLRLASRNLSISRVSSVVS